MEKLIEDSIKLNIKGKTSYLTIKELVELKNAIGEVLGSYHRSYSFTWAFPTDGFPISKPNPIPTTPPEPSDGTAGNKWTFKPPYTICWSKPNTSGYTASIDFAGDIS